MIDKYQHRLAQKRQRAGSDNLQLQASDCSNGGGVSGGGGGAVGGGDDADSDINVDFSDDDD